LAEFRAALADLRACLAETQAVCARAQRVLKGEGEAMSIDDDPEREREVAWWRWQRGAAGCGRPEAECIAMGCTPGCPRAADEGDGHDVV
jgi:hypothetical protein